MEGYIFDLDGVLVDTATFHYQAWKRLAEEWFGYPFTEAENERFKGVNRIACMRILCDLAGVTVSDDEPDVLTDYPKTDATINLKLDPESHVSRRQISREDFERGMALKNAWYVELVQTMTPADVLPGAREFVERARAAGIRCAIGSASKNCGLVLEKTKLRNLFDAVADGLVVTKAKPDPEVFLCAARMLCISPENCVVFEDAQVGIDAAKAGGMRCYAIG